MSLVRVAGDLGFVICVWVWFVRCVLGCLNLDFPWLISLGVSFRLFVLIVLGVCSWLVGFCYGL